MKNANLTTSNDTAARRFARRLRRLAVFSLASVLAFVVLKSQIDALQTPDATTSSTRSDSGSTPRPNASVAAKPLWKIWFDAWRNPGTNTPPNTDANNAASKNPAPTRVWVDVESLARRHPAWRLSERLAADATLQNVVAPVAAPRNRFFADRDFAFDNVLRRADFARADVEDRVLDVGDFLGGRSAFTADAQRESVLARRARAAQNALIDNLSRDLSGDLSRERTLREREARAVLQEEIEAARAAGLSAISPILLSDAEQLELTNLRLKLLPSSILSVEEKRQARERLLILQSRWDEALRRQEAQNLADIEELREVEPRRLRVEGETAIALSQNRLQAADASRLRSLRESQNALLARDFNGLQPLRLPSDFAPTDFASPASPLPSLSTPNRATIARAPSIDVLPLPTTDRVLDVATGFVNASRDSNATQRVNLRAQARREAWAWTRLTAQRNGWQVATTPVANGKTLRNATEEVWRVWKN